jgi:cell division protein FtsB
MKRFFILLAIVSALSAEARAQYSVAVVSDPIAQLAHSDDMAQWAQSIQALNTQISQFNQQIQQLQTMKNFIGDPAAAAGSMGLGNLGTGQLTSSVGQLSSSLNQTANGTQALTNTSGGLFPSTSLQTPSGFDFQANSDLFKPFAAIQQQVQNVTGVIGDTLSRITGLQQDKAATLAQIQSSTNQSEVQKLQAKVNAIDGQIADLNNQQGTAQAQLVTQDIANRNDRQMKADAANQAADQEMSVSLDNYSKWQGGVGASRKDFK